MKDNLDLDDKALRKRSNRRRFKDLRNLHALVDCREDYLSACWKWLYGREKLGEACVAGDNKP